MSRLKGADLGVTNPTLASLGAAKNTIGAGLPPFTGRNSGDEHYDTAAKVLYSLTGAPGSGGSLSDTFTGSDAASVVGRTTETGGATWAALTNGLGGAPALVSNKMSFDSAANYGAYVALGTAGTHDVSADLTLASGGRISLYVRISGTDSGTGYKLEVDRGAGTVLLKRGSGTLLATFTGAPAAGPETYRLTATGTSTITLTASRNGVQLGTPYVDATPGTVGNNVGLVGVGGSAGQFSQADNFGAVDIGTLAWTPLTVSAPMNYRGNWSASPSPAYAINDVVLRNGMASVAMVVPGATDPAGGSAALGAVSGGTISNPFSGATPVAQPFTVSSPVTVSAVRHRMAGGGSIGGRLVGIASSITAGTVTWLSNGTSASGTADGSTLVVTLGSAVTLVPGTTYYFVTNEAWVGVATSGGVTSGVVQTTTAAPITYGASFGTTAPTADQLVFELDGNPWAPLAPTIETVNTVAASGSAVTLPDVAVATMHRVVLTAATPAITLPAPVAGKSLTVAVVQDATGGRAPTWVTPSGAIRWPGGTAPTITATANAVDVVSFACIDGTNWLGLVAGQAFA